MVRERHLGLHMPGDEDVPGDYIARLAQLMEDSLDLDRLLEIANRAETPSVAVDPPPRPAGQRVRLAVARDAAFCFYYTECGYSSCYAWSTLSGVASFFANE